MCAAEYNTIKEKKYSKLFSSLFSLFAIIVLTILCLLNNMALDFYCAYFLLKTVAPATFCFWILGFVIGKIFDSLSVKLVVDKQKNEEQAYKIPSIFSESYSEDDSSSMFAGAQTPNTDGEISLEYNMPEDVDTKADSKGES